MFFFKQENVNKLETINVLNDTVSSLTLTIQKPNTNNDKVKTYKI